MSDPFAEGEDAFHTGLDESANPYDPDGIDGGDAFMSWNDGWTAGAEAQD